MSASTNLAAAATANAFTFDGTSSTTFKCIAYPLAVDTSPEKDYTAQAVPGQSGDILISNRRYANVEHSYQCIIYENFDTNFSSLKSFLLSRNGYCRLSDTVHTDEFYHAYYVDAIEPVISRDRVMGKFTLVFRRKPQRWLVSGETETTVTFSSSTSVNLTNPSYFYAAPLFDVYGSLSASGTFTISYYCHISVNNTDTIENSITFTMPSVYSGTIRRVVIDTDTMTVYGKQQSTPFELMNNCVTYDVSSDPETALRIRPNTTQAIYFTNTSNLTSAKITPRWYRL